MTIIYHDNGKNPGWKSLPFPLTKADLQEVHLHATCMIIITVDALTSPLISLLDNAAAHPLFQKSQL